MIDVQVIVDTNVISHLFKESPLAADYWALMGERSAGISVMSLQELHYGVAVDGWSEQRIHRFDVFLNRFSVVPTATQIAQICAQIRVERKRVGEPIDLADAWITATALWYGIPLVTHDRDLEGIPGLQVLTLHTGWQVCDSAVHGVYRTWSPFHASPSREAIMRAGFTSS